MVDVMVMMMINLLMVRTHRQLVGCPRHDAVVVSLSSIAALDGQLIQSPSSAADANGVSLLQ
jgi:hypothetical protein